MGVCGVHGDGEQGVVVGVFHFGLERDYVIGTTTVPWSFQLFQNVCVIPYLLSIRFVNVAFAEHTFCQCCIIFHRLQTELSSVFMK